jgi:UDP-GlcNAc3NAcA epimerase
VVAQTPGVEEILLHTGQHFDENMSKIFFQEMGIPHPEYRLEVANLSHGGMTGRMLESIEEVLMTERPDWVLVYGDTNSTLAGALAAQKLHIPVAHVEAGLRSFNMKMPEEANRVLTDRLSDVLFCPTEAAVENLKNEGYEHLPTVIQQPGDVMYDAALFYSKQSSKNSNIIRELGYREFVLFTLHRAENTGSPKNMKAIIQALEEIHATIPVVWPMHPRTKRVLETLGLAPKLRILDPVGYFSMLELIKHSKLVITDSGGLQKEAFFFKKQCVTLREQTEWTELIKHDWNRLAKTEVVDIRKKIEAAMTAPVSEQLPLYGDGHAAEKIVSSLQQIGRG